MDDVDDVNVEVLDKAPVRSWSSDIATVGYPKACREDLIGIDNLYQSKELEVDPEDAKPGNSSCVKTNVVKTTAQPVAQSRDSSVVQPFV
ncbi:hypothetical protein U1Q18_025682 [Sarracenia purpurea var. burkii]